MVVSIVSLCWTLVPGTNKTVLFPPHESIEPLNGDENDMVVCECEWTNEDG